MKSTTFVQRSLVGLALTFASAFVGTSPLSATPIFYVATQGTGTTGGSCPTGPCGSSLGTVDFTGGLLGAFVNITGLQSGEEIFDIAVNTAGEIYGTSATRLYRISTTGAATLVGVHNGAGIAPNSSLVGGGTFNGLTFLGATLYAVGNSGYLFTLDLNTGAASATSNTAGLYQSNGDIGVVGGRLFIGTTDHNIVEVDATGAVLNSGPNGLGSGVAGIKGLAGDGANLYAVSSCNSNGCGGFENLTRIDVTPGGTFGTIVQSVLWNGNGNLTAVGLPGGMSEFVGVPEPGTYLLTALGLGAIGLCGRRKRQQ